MNKHKLKAFSNMTRLQIIDILSRTGELNVGELEKRTRLSQSALSQHLSIMREANLVSARRQAQQVFYSVQDKAVLAITNLLLNW